MERWRKERHAPSIRVLRQAFKALLADYVQPDLATRLLLLDYHVCLLVVGGMAAIEGLDLPGLLPGEGDERIVPMHEAVNWSSSQPYPYARRRS